jgi:hypothetical protein
MHRRAQRRSSVVGPLCPSVDGPTHGRAQLWSRKSHNALSRSCRPHLRTDANDGSSSLCAPFAARSTRRSFISRRTISSCDVRVARSSSAPPSQDLRPAEYRYRTPSVLSDPRTKRGRWGRSERHRCDRRVGRASATWTRSGEGCAYHALASERQRDISKERRFSASAVDLCAPGAYAPPSSSVCSQGYRVVPRTNGASADRTRRFATPRRS